MSNMTIAIIIVFILAPLLRKGHKYAHETTKKNMPEGWLKFILTHEFCKRRPAKT